MDMDGNEATGNPVDRADRVIRDGMVAVLYSPGFGAGWSTWNDDQRLIFDPALVASVEALDYAGVEARATEIEPEGYWGGMDGLTIKWLPLGTQFRITEYDGSESVETADALVMVA